MEVLKSGTVPELVADIELLDILQSKRKHYSTPKKKGKLRHRDFIELKVYKYLKSGPCDEWDRERLPTLVRKLKAPICPVIKISDPQSDPKKALKKSNDEGPTKVGFDDYLNDTTMVGMTQEQGFGLVDGEVLQVLNLIPREPVDIHLITEELMDRMDEDQQNDLLALIEKHTKNGEDVMEEE